MLYLFDVELGPENSCRADPACLPFHVSQHQTLFHAHHHLQPHIAQEQSNNIIFPLHHLIMLPIFKNGCFWFGIIINFVLLTLAIYTAQSGKPFAVWVSLLVAFLLAFVCVVTISMFPERHHRLHSTDFA